MKKLHPLLPPARNCAIIHPLAEVAKWQTHLTQNQAGIPHAGSSPAFGTSVTDLRQASEVCYHKGIPGANFFKNFFENQEGIPQEAQNYS